MQSLLDPKWKMFAKVADAGSVSSAEVRCLWAGPKFYAIAQRVQRTSQIMAEDGEKGVA